MKLINNGVYRSTMILPCCSLDYITLFCLSGFNLTRFVTLILGDAVFLRRKPFFPWYPNIFVWVGWFSDDGDCRTVIHLDYVEYGFGSFYLAVTEDKTQYNGYCKLLGDQEVHGFRSCSKLNCKVNRPNDGNRFSTCTADIWFVLEFAGFVADGCGILPSLMKLDPAPGSMMTANCFVYRIVYPMFAYTLYLRFANTKMALGSLSRLKRNHGRCRKPVALELAPKDWSTKFAGDGVCGRGFNFCILDPNFLKQPLTSFLPLYLGYYHFLLVLDSFITKNRLWFLYNVSGTIARFSTVRAS